LKLRLKGDNDCGVIEEGGSLAPREGGNHGGSGAAARWHEASGDSCLASDGGRGQGRDRGLLGPSGSGGGGGFCWVHFHSRETTCPKDAGACSRERAGLAKWSKPWEWASGPGGLAQLGGP
jgi:hypothetical protein